MARRKDLQIPAAVLDHLLSGSPASSAFEQGGLLDQLLKALAERALNGEMDHHVAKAQFAVLLGERYARAMA